MLLVHDILNRCNLMEILNTILQLFISRQHTIDKKIKWAFFIISCLVIIDLIFGISYQISISSKLENINKIEQIKLNSISNITLVDYLDKLESEIIARKDFYSGVKYFFRNDVPNYIIPANTKANSSNKEIIWHSLRHIITSSYAGIIIFFMLLYEIFKIIILKQKIYISKIVYALSIALLFISINSYLFGLIPIISKSGDYLYNYILNSLLQLVFLFIISFMIGTIITRKKI